MCALKEDACCFGFGYNSIRGSSVNDEWNADIEGEVLLAYAISLHSDLLISS